MKILQNTVLFWDVDANNIDPKKNEKFLIERILQYGNQDDVKWAGDKYGSKKIKDYVIKSNALDAKSLFFWCQYFNISKKKCIQKQSRRKQSPFWKK